MIRVLYDISALGFGHRHGKTGIFRVARTVAQGLAHHPDCALELCASQSFQLLSDALAYLRSDETLAEVPFVMSPAGRRLGVPLCERLRTPDLWGKLSLPEQLIQRLLWRGLALAEKRFKPISPEDLSACDIFHTPLGPLPPRRVGRQPRRFLTVHDLVRWRFPKMYPPDALFESLLDHLGPDDWAICVSQSTRDDLCHYKPQLDPERCFVIPLAASDKFRPCPGDVVAAIRQKYRLGESPYLLSLSTLEPRKNLLHSLRAFSRLVRQEKLDDLRYVLVGLVDRSGEAIKAELAGDPVLRERVILTGFVDDADIAAIYCGALAFVYPSLYEGFGLPLLEAMQCGVPVITADNSSLPEVVGDAGLLVDAADGDGLSQAMLDLYADAQLRTELAGRGLERAKGFSWERCLEETVSAYRTALGAT